MPNIYEEPQGRLTFSMVEHTFLEGHLMIPPKDHRIHRSQLCIVVCVVAELQGFCTTGYQGDTVLLYDHNHILHVRLGL